jgi:hypothetical protein
MTDLTFSRRCHFGSYDFGRPSHDAQAHKSALRYCEGDQVRLAPGLNW